MTVKMDSDAALLSATLSNSGMADDDSFLDGCSICLEPFTSVDPPSVTKCKHEYHLHCILDWSQRRVECPVCLRHLVLNDPASQELLAAVEREKNSRSRRTFVPVNQGNEVYNAVYMLLKPHALFSLCAFFATCTIFQNSPIVHESDDEQPIMRHVAAIASRARNFTRRRRETIPSVGPSHILPSVPVNASNVAQLDGSSSEHQNHGSADADSSRSPYQNPGRSSSSELAAFSESLKSKISTASIRYKESISKSTLSLKEKLIARNDTVKELSRGVQREMSAGIAGIARMIAQKRGGASTTSEDRSIGGETSKEI